MKRAVSVAMSLAAVSSLIAASCATSNTFIVNNAPPGSALVVDDRQHPLKGEPVIVSVETGTDPVPWRVERAGGVVVDEGIVERTELEWGVVALGTGMAACCMPSGALLGFCVANPSLFAAPFTIVLGDAGSVVNTIQSPGWASIPFTTVGIAAGAIPLLLGLVAQSPPDVVTLNLPRTVEPTAPLPPLDERSQPVPPSPASTEPSSSLPSAAPPTTPTPTPSLNRPSATTPLRDQAVSPLPPAVDDGATTTGSGMSF